VKLSDYVASRIADHGLTHVFMVTGGGAMHLNDSFGFEPRLRTVFNHHEQACAMAAEGFARVANRPAVVNVTTGPGGINALTGVHGAFTDSIPMLVVSGQVRRDTLVGSHDVPGLRQLGDQEADIVAMARGIVKYGVLVSEPATIRFHLEKALHLITEGRPGPCWLDIPIDVQGAQVDHDAMAPYVPEAEAKRLGGRDLAEACGEVATRLASAERPVLLVGTGVRLAGAEHVLASVARRIAAPLAPGWTAVDLVASDDPLYCGRPGTVGDRPGNFAVQNADLLLVVGCRLNIRQVSYNWRSFARGAYLVQVDVDDAELRKPTIGPHLGICADARDFLEALDQVLQARQFDGRKHAAWLSWCRARVERYPVVRPEHRRLRDGRINPYDFVDRLFGELTATDVVVCGNATASVVGFQAARIQRGQRVFANSGCAAMGYDLPASVGAATAAPDRRVICLAGDGSLQLNVQEMQTLVQHALPVKVFALNNGGYLSMRMSQSNFFGRFVGESPASGISFPSAAAIAAAYGIESTVAEGPQFMDAVIRTLTATGPAVCEVILDPEQAFEPKLSSRRLPDGRIVSSPLEDLHPFLSREELADNMIIPPLEP
jgi:acetolactate synthase-1/2/3 large subunit